MINNRAKILNNKTLQGIESLNIEKDKKQEIEERAKIRNKENNRKIIGYFNSMHENYVIKQLNILDDLGFATETNNIDLSNLYSVKTYPTFLFVKNNSLLLKLEGKYMNNILIKKLYEIGWL